MSDHPTQKPQPDNTQHSQETGIHAPGRIRTRNPSNQAAAERKATVIGISLQLCISVKFSVMC